MSLINPDLSGIVDGSVGDAADWTTPMNTIINVINGNLDTSNLLAAGVSLSTVAANEGWTSWSPTYAGSGSMTYGTVTTSYAKYVRLGRIVFFQLRATGTTGGTASSDILFSLPVTSSAAFGSFASFTGDSGTKGGVGFFNSTSQGGVSKYDSSNWALAAGKEIQVFGCYEAAN